MSDPVKIPDRVKADALVAEARRQLWGALRALESEEPLRRSRELRSLLPMIEVLGQLRVPSPPPSGHPAATSPPPSAASQGPPLVDLTDDEKNNRIERPEHCGECYPLSHPNKGFNQPLNKPCPNCKLGRARSDAYAAAAKRREAGPAVDLSPPEGVAPKKAKRL